MPAAEKKHASKINVCYLLHLPRPGCKRCAFTGLKPFATRPFARQDPSATAIYSHLHAASLFHNTTTVLKSINHERPRQYQEYVERLFCSLSFLAHTLNDVCNDHRFGAHPASFRSPTPVGNSKKASYLRRAKGTRSASGNLPGFASAICTSHASQPGRPAAAR